MIATLFDGTTTVPCTAEQAQSAANQPGISWIDIRLQGNDQDAAASILTAAGIEATTAQQVMTQGLSSDFSVTPQSIQGVCWIDDVDGTPAEQVYFTWNQMRLVTVRGGGDAAIAQIRGRITERIDVLHSEPSTLLGVVLQFMLATVQQGLTRTMIGVGALDLEIIATNKPTSTQTQQLNDYRQVFQPLALRFPLYLVNVQTSLIDTGTVAGLDAAGMTQLQQFATAAQSTGGLIDTLVSAVRNAAQDIQGQVSNWQSDRINVLTIVTMIFLPITFLTGYFGMNFQWLDNQLNSFWMWVLLGLGLPIALVVICIRLLGLGGYTVPKLRRDKRKPSGRSTT